jgi:hypothetical protein
MWTQEDSSTVRFFRLPCAVAVLCLSPILAVTTTRVSTGKQSVQYNSNKYWRLLKLQGMVSNGLALVLAILAYMRQMILTLPAQA